MPKNKYTCLTKGNFTKIFINGILHLSIPSGGQIIIQSWVMSASWFVIEINVNDTLITCEYDCFDKWKAILNLLNESIK